MDKHLAELIGIIMGDGFLDGCQKHYRIGVVGDPIGDREYFDYVQALIKRVWNKDVTAVHRSRALRIVFSSKPVFLQLTQQYNLHAGEGKSECVTLHDCILADWNLAKHAIRGLADTDGTIFLSDKRGAPNYPSIELCTNSIVLVNQLRTILAQQGFRVTKVWRYWSKMSAHYSYKIGLNGYAQVEKWMQEIGFSNPRKRRIAEMTIRAGQTSSDPCTARR